MPRKSAKLHKPIKKVLKKDIKRSIKRRQEKFYMGYGMGTSSLKGWMLHIKPGDLLDIHYL